MEIYFDGYCPESLLKNKKVEMRLNEDDFWESEATGLQIAVFPPYATILKWRGKGNFREKSGVASNSLVGLILTEPQIEEDKEIFRDKSKIIDNKFDLDWYLACIFNSREEFEASRFDPKDPVFNDQETYLKSISAEKFNELIAAFDAVNETRQNKDIISSEVFRALHNMLYELKLIFNYKWMVWHKGWKNLNDADFDYSPCSMLDISMYLTAIFRSDRFNDGTIQHYLRNGTLNKIFRRLNEIASGN